MFTYISQEFQKNWKRNHAWVFLGLSCLIAALYFIVTFHTNNPNQEDYIQQFSLENQLNFYPDLNTEENPQFVPEKYYYETGTFDESDDVLLQMLIGVNWSGIRYGNLYHHNIFTGQDRSNRAIDQTEDFWRVDRASSLMMAEQFRYLAENKIEPRHPVRSQFTEYDKENAYKLSANYGGEALEDALRVLDYEASRYDKGWYQLWEFLKNNAHLYLLSVVSLLFSGLLVMEHNPKHPHIRLLKVEGMGASILYSIKYLVSVLSGSIFFFITALAVLVTSIFHIGVGSLKYPLIYYFYHNERISTTEVPEWFLHPAYQTETAELGHLQVTSISLGLYLFQSAILLFLILCFTFALIYLFSIMVNNEALVSLFGLIISLITLVLPISPNNPFSYFNIHHIVTGEMRLIHENNLMSFGRGAWLLGGSSLILFVIGILWYTVREKKAEVIT